MVYSPRMEQNVKQVSIAGEFDVALAAFDAKNFAETAGFTQSEQCMIATAVSELARNMWRYAGKGDIFLKLLDRNAANGIEVIAVDHGPGIRDVEQALKDHFSTSGSLGLGLPGVKRLMDEFDIESERGSGTTVTTRKWLRGTEE